MFTIPHHQIIEIQSISIHSVLAHVLDHAGKKIMLFYCKWALCGSDVCERL